MTSDLTRRFITAVKAGDIMGVRAGLQAGVDIHHNNDMALYWAVDRQLLDIVKLLIEHGANIHAYSGYILCWACYQGYTDIVRLLIRRGPTYMSKVTALSY